MTQTNPIKTFHTKPTRKYAINAMCAYCHGVTSTVQGNGSTDHLEPGFRTAIRNCTAPGCPLWKWRPFQKENTSTEPPGLDLEQLTLNLPDE